MPRPQPAQQPPPVQRLTIRYAKRGRARFASHRDFARAFERALRRANAPMAYSSGFNPHQRISWANPAPTGAESEAEYVEVGLADRVDPTAFKEVLNAALPDGFAVLAIAAATGAALAVQLTASTWEVDLGAVCNATLQSALDRYLAVPTVLVTRETKNGLREFDTRPAVVAAVAAASRLRVTLRHQEPLVRPDDIIKALVAIEPALAEAAWRIRRVAQGTLAADGSIEEPLLVPRPQAG